MFTRKPKHFTGLDHSGPTLVLPPTFGGVKQLVERVGESAAKLAYSVPDQVEDDDASHDLVRDFLSEIRFMDAVERQTAIREFSDFVSELQNSQLSNPAAAAGDGAKAEPLATDGAPEAQPADVG